MESASSLQDRWIWAGAIAFFTVAAIGIRYAIHDIVRLTEIEPIKPSPSKGDIMICDDTKDIDNEDRDAPSRYFVLGCAWRPTYARSQRSNSLLFVFS